MPTIKNKLVIPKIGGYYHLINRCIKHFNLCASDKKIKADYKHQRKCIERRILQMAHIFSVNVYAYAALRSQYHLVIYSDPQAPLNWTAQEIAERWLKLAPMRMNGTKGKLQREERLQALINNSKLIEKYRYRLGCLSWMIKFLNQSFAQENHKEGKVNRLLAESHCSVQPLLDETAVLACMTYIDLSPTLSGIYKKPLDSQFTSIQNRCKYLREHDLLKPTLSIAGNVCNRSLTLLLKDYSQLVEWTGKNITCLNDAKIPTYLNSLLSDLHLNKKNWLSQIKTIASNEAQMVVVLPN